MTKAEVCNYCNAVVTKWQRFSKHSFCLTILSEIFKIWEWLILSSVACNWFFFSLIYRISGAWPAWPAKAAGDQHGMGVCFVFLLSLSFWRNCFQTSSKPSSQLSSVLTFSLAPHYLSLVLFLSLLKNYPSFIFSGGCHLKSTKQLNQYDNEPLDSSIYSNDCLLLESESDCGFDDGMGPEGQAGLSSMASIDLNLKWTSSDLTSMLNISPHMPAEDIKTWR